MTQQISLLVVHPQEIIVEKVTCTNIHCNTVYSNWDMQTRLDCHETDAWIKIVVHIDSGILLIYRKQRV